MAAFSEDIALDDALMRCELHQYIAAEFTRRLREATA
jgi:hypothetical protein